MKKNQRNPSVIICFNILMSHVSFGSTSSVRFVWDLLFFVGGGIHTWSGWENLKPFLACLTVFGCFSSMSSMSDARKMDCNSYLLKQHWQLLVSLLGLSSQQLMHKCQPRTLCIVGKWYNHWQLGIRHLTSALVCELVKSLCMFLCLDFPAGKIWIMVLACHEPHKSKGALKLLSCKAKPENLNQ